MPTTADYLNDLVAQKNALADNLNTKGVSASQNETLNTLVPKILQISGEGGGDSGSYDEGYADGKQAQYDEFWDGYQQNGARTNYANAFLNEAWTDVIYNPKHDITAKYYSSMYQQSRITDTKKPITFQSGGSGSSVFLNCTKLETIRTLTVNSNMTFGSWFSGCSKLTNVTFSGEIGNDISFSASPLLSHDSIINIISVLVNTTTKKTLSLGEINLAKLTDEEKAVATEKGWTLA